VNDGFAGVECRFSVSSSGEGFFAGADCCSLGPSSGEGFLPGAGAAISGNSLICSRDPTKNKIVR